MGTAGSLKLLPKEMNGSVLVLNADVLTNLDLTSFAQFHEEQEASITIASRHESYTVPYGVIESEGVDFVKIEEKPTTNILVNAGIYIIRLEVLNLIKYKEYFDMPSLITCAKENNFKVVVFPIHEYWIDVGRPDTLKKAHEDWPGK